MQTYERKIIKLYNALLKICYSFDIGLGKGFVNYSKLNNTQSKL